MSVEHIALALHHSRAKGSAKLVLIGIANHAGDGGAYPSLETLARYAGVTVRQAQRALRTLEALGEIRTHVQAGGSADWDDHRRPNRYEVLVPCPAWCDRSPNHRDTRRTSGPQISLPIDVSTGVTPVTPEQVTGVTWVTPHPVTPVTPKPKHLTPPKKEVVNLTVTARACDYCSQTEKACKAQLARLGLEVHGHTFRPGAIYFTKG